MFAPKIVSSGVQPRKSAAVEPRLRDQRLGRAARPVRAADVRVRLAQVARDRVDHLVRHLRPAGAVEEGERRVERREAAAHRVDVEPGFDRHEISFPFTIHEYRGCGLSELPMKQPRSARVSKGRSLPSSGSGVSSTSSRHWMSTNALRASSRRATTPVAVAEAADLDPVLAREPGQRVDAAARDGGEQEVLGRPAGAGLERLAPSAVMTPERSRATA